MTRKTGLRAYLRSSDFKRHAFYWFTIWQMPIWLLAAPLLATGIYAFGGLHPGPTYTAYDWHGNPYNQNEMAWDENQSWVESFGIAIIGIELMPLMLAALVLAALMGKMTRMAIAHIWRETTKQAEKTWKIGRWGPP